MTFKRRLRKLFYEQDYDNLEKRVGVSLIILIIALMIFSGYFLFFHVTSCEDINCFANALAVCKKVSWIREDVQASWLYVINGNSKENSCKVEVKLLKIKQGAIEIEKLQNKKMTCNIQKGSKEFPEKDISKCTGTLKEDLQEIIIQRMHNYLLENIGEIKKENFSSL